MSVRVETDGGKGPTGEKKAGAPFVVSLFVSHAGCPHRCLFCDQEKTTGWSVQCGREADAVMVREEVARQLAWPRRDRAAGVEVAFYGGSFTALVPSRQEALLQAVEPFLSDGRVQRLRISTRPDALDPPTVGRLWRFGVRVVELGCQTLDNAVLKAACRGHTAADVERAFALLRQYPFQVGAHLMPGLPGAGTGEALESARALAALGPDFVRIHPTLVIKGSGLARLFGEGRYRPLSLSRAIILCGKMKLHFDACGIPVVRMGLQPTPTLGENVLAGPWHPAFGELVRSWILLRTAKALLAGRVHGGRQVFRVARADESAFRGQGNRNIHRLQRLVGCDTIYVLPDPELQRGTVMLEGEACTNLNAAPRNS